MHIYFEPDLDVQLGKVQKQLVFIKKPLTSMIDFDSGILETLRLKQIVLSFFKPLHLSLHLILFEVKFS